MSRQYDYEDDPEELEENNQKQQLLEFEEDIKFTKLTADINQLYLTTKAHDQALKSMQREIQARVTEPQLSETIALINTGIQGDPNIIKMLKTREAMTTDEEGSKSKFNALLFSKKLNQMSQSLSVFLGIIRKLQARVNTVESDLTCQLNEKHSAQQTQIQEARSEQVRENMELQQKMELLSFQLSDKVREIQTKSSWKMNELGSKVDQKISQQFVKSYLQSFERKVEKSMREYQLSSSINPERIDLIEHQIQQNNSNLMRAIGECEYRISSVKTEMSSNLVKKQLFEEHMITVEKRLDNFNSNFTQVYQRVMACQKREIKMSSSLQRLQQYSESSRSELKRINTVLTNLKIGEDFQKMLEEMNPTKVLELQDKVDGVENEQNNIFRQIQHAKRQIDKINAKSDIMGIMLPNKAKQKLRKEELQEALDSFLQDHQFSQKIASIDRQLCQYKLSVDQINILSKQVARIQKEDESHRIGLQLRSLEQNVKKELLLIHQRLKEGGKKTEQIFRSKGIKNESEDVQPIGQALHGRSFSVKKVRALATDRKDALKGSKLKGLEN